jgi:SMI1-KNR4 cell-wall
MNKTKLEKLQFLIERLEIINPDMRETSSADQFLDIEKKINYKLPDDYKYFSQKLGSGFASQLGVNITCLDKRNINDILEVPKDMIKTIEEHRKKLRKQDAKHIELLNSALVFGGFNGDRAVLWDLRSFNTKDDSYDIYWYSKQMPDADEPIFIGRDFTNFLYNFCYGQLPCSLIPGFCVDEPLIVEYTFAYRPYIFQSELYWSLNNG